MGDADALPVEFVRVRVNRELVEFVNLSMEPPDDNAVNPTAEDLPRPTAGDPTADPTADLLHDPEDPQLEKRFTAQ